MILRLMIDGKEQTFKTGFISGRKLRDTIAIQKRLNEPKLSESEMDELAGYVCAIFNGEFTIDQFYDGIDSRKFFETVIECTSEVMGLLSEATTGDETSEKN